MNVRKRVVQAAESQLGVRELTGSNDGVPAERYMRGDELAWCAAFVLWCYDVAGQPMYSSVREYYSLRNVQRMEDSMKARGVWYGPALYDVVEPGDVVFFGSRIGSDAGPGRHVGVVEQASYTGVHTIEGNVSDGVRRMSYAFGDPKITGFARPQ